MITDQRIGPYLVEIDENGDEVLSLELPWRLPEDYRRNEVTLAVENLVTGHHRADLLISRNTLFQAVQEERAEYACPAWGERFDTEEKRMAIRDAKRGES